MSTYFKIDPAMMPWPPVFEKVFTRQQFTMLTDGFCLAEAEINETELQALKKAGAEIIGIEKDAHEWINNHPDLFLVQEDI